MDFGAVIEGKKRDFPSLGKWHCADTGRYQSNQQHACHISSSFTNRFI